MRLLCLLVAALLVMQGAGQKFLALDDRESVLLVLKGVVEGLALESQISLDSIKACISDTELVWNDLRDAVELLQSNELEKVKLGIKKIGEAIQVLPDAITACHTTEQELISVAKEITSLLAQMRHPLTFGFIVGKNLVLNGREIFQETCKKIIQTNLQVGAVQAYHKGEYEAFGIDVGRILYQLLIGKVQNYEALDSSFQTTLQIYQGVVLGFYEAGGVKIEDIQSCVFGTEQVVTDFIGAVQLILTRDSKNVKEGLRLLGMGLQILPEALLKCQGTYAAIQKLSAELTQTIAMLQTPQTFAFHVGKDLLINGRDIYREINNAVADWNNENYMGFGEEVGKALFQLFVGVAKPISAIY